MARRYLLIGADAPKDRPSGGPYPTFSDWPARRRFTHQALYYRWIERAWMGGLRLLVG